MEEMENKGHEVEESMNRGRRQEWDEERGRDVNHNGAV
jgi:hypothetical protein